MRWRIHIHDQIQKLTANLIDYQRAVDVSMCDLGINFALSDKDRIHPVLLKHRFGSGLREREVWPLTAHYNAPHQ